MCVQCAAPGFRYADSEKYEPKNFRTCRFYVGENDDEQSVPLEQVPDEVRRAWREWLGDDGGMEAGFCWETNHTARAPRVWICAADKSGPGNRVSGVEDGWIPGTSRYHCRWRRPPVLRQQAIMKPYNAPCKVLTASYVRRNGVTHGKV